MENELAKIIENRIREDNEESVDLECNDESLSDVSL
jgi:hypothetical protein